MGPAELSAKLEYLCNLRDRVGRGDLDNQLLTTREEAVEKINGQIAEGYMVLRQLVGMNWTQLELGRHR